MNSHSIVIGASKGLGRAVAKLFASEKHAVSVIARHELSSKDAGSQIQSWTADVSQPKDLLAALHQAIKKNGPPSNVIFAQRFRGEKDVWDGEISTGLTSTHQVIEELADQFPKGKGGSIVIISSVLWDKVSPQHHAGYHVAKAAAIQLARYYALVLGPKQIRVNAVSPCTFIKDESTEYFEKNKNLMDLYKKVIPLQRLPHADEIADLISFLCSKKASFITGQNIVIDGGFSLRWIETLAMEFGLRSQ